MYFNYCKYVPSGMFESNIRCGGTKSQLQKAIQQLANLAVPFKVTKHKKTGFHR